MQIGISGYGKMGKAIERVALSRHHDIRIVPKGKPISDLDQADCIIEFTRTEVAPGIVRECIDAGVPVISGTTGWASELESMRTYCLEHGGAMLWAPNFSIGMHITFALNKALAKMMDKRHEYDVAIHEIHHTEKKDAPSGTAIALADQIIGIVDRKTSWKLIPEAGAVDPSELAIRADRIPDVKGDHQIAWSGPDDTISIRHEAKSRDGFALGAVIAGEWIKGKTGVFTFEDVLRDILE
jgi:4-hydroxy-tetrahydrodipicolinate reductase